MEQEQSDNAIFIQKALNRMLNTDDGKIVLAHLMNEFVLKSAHVPSVTGIDMAHATGKADLVRAFFLTANANL
jgi:hypothetical protein